MTTKTQMTTAAGCPVADNQNALTAGPRGPVLMQDVHLGAHPGQGGTGHRLEMVDFRSPKKNNSLVKESIVLLKRTKIPA